ncbi:6665_t:CDS:2, partial [Acaulospora colombiana]
PQIPNTSNMDQSTSRRRSIFRPCIDLHHGQVKQIVGGTLSDSNPDDLKTNFVSTKSSAEFATLYKEHDLRGGHIIKLGPGNDDAAKAALKAWPDRLHLGGGISEENALEWIQEGAEKVTQIRLSSLAGKERLVVDVRRGDEWIVAMNRWQDLTDMKVDRGDSPPPTTRHSRVPSKLSEIAVGTPRHSRIPSNMAPASPTTPTTFITQTNAKGKDDDFADADLMPYDDDGKKPKKRDTFQPPPPISTLQGGYRKSTYSEMSASPTVAGSEYHFGKGKERSSYYPPGRQSSGNSDNHNLMSPSPTETSFQDARQSYYSNPNASVGALPLPNAATMPTIPASAGVPVVVEDFPAIPEEPHTAPARTHQQETQRAAFMAALEEPLAPPRRPRGLGGLTPGGNEGGRMSAYQRLSPTQDSFDPAELNRHSYAAPTPPNGAGMQGGAHRSSYAGGSRRGPFVSNPSPFNPNNSS